MPQVFERVLSPWVANLKAHRRRPRRSARSTRRNTRRGSTTSTSTSSWRRSICGATPLDGLDAVLRLQGRRPAGHRTTMPASRARRSTACSTSCRRSTSRDELVTVAQGDRPGAARRPILRAELVSSPTTGSRTGTSSAGRRRSRTMPSRRRRRWWFDADKAAAIGYSGIGERWAPISSAASC